MTELQKIQDMNRKKNYILRYYKGNKKRFKTKLLDDHSNYEDLYDEFVKIDRNTLPVFSFKKLLKEHKEGINKVWKKTQKATDFLKQYENVSPYARLIHKKSSRYNPYKHKNPLRDK